MSKKMYPVDFFQLAPGQVGLSTSRLSEKLATLSEIEFKPQAVGSHNVTFKDVRKTTDGFIVGAALKVLMENIPPSYDTMKKEVTPLSLNENQGLVEATCFLIDPNLRILLKDKSGLSPAGFGKYLKEPLELLESLEYAIVISPSELERFYNLKTILRFNTKMVKIEKGMLFSEGKQRVPINQLVNAADNTNTDMVNIVMEIAPKKRKKGESLSKSTIVAMVDELLGYKESEEVKELKITGINEENQQVILDLISERLQDMYEVEHNDRIIQDLQINKRLSELILIYKKHQTLLNDFYAKNQNIS